MENRHQFLADAIMQRDMYKSIIERHGPGWEYSTIPELCLSWKIMSRDSMSITVGSLTLVFT